MNIEIRHLYASYAFGNQRDVLHGISLTICEGRRLALLGENGSGKTTLLRVLSGILPYRGSVKLGADELCACKRRMISERIAHLQQISGSYYAYTVRDTVSHGRYLKERRGFFAKDTEKKSREKTDDILRALGLLELADRPIDTLSGGQLQRTFLARSFAQETPYLLLDEPANHLDLQYQSQLATYLTKWSSQQTTLSDGTVHPHTMVGVFHDLPLAFFLAEDVALLKNGTLLFHGTKETLLQKKELLQEAFSLDVLGYLQSLQL